MTADVIIIGAGPVGLTAALLCARQGLRVDVIEKRLGPVTAPRAVAVDDETLRIWQSCGLDEEILGLRLVSIHNVRFLVRLGEMARAHILAGTFDGWSREWLRRYHMKGES